MKHNEDITVYLINGFLESGKTEFINFTLEQPYFKTDGITLLIVCEEGEKTYTRAFLRRNNIKMEVIENEADFNLEELTKLSQKHDPSRILIEYNGMWNHKNIEFPKHWYIDQQVTIIDTTTFGMFYSNMKSMVGEMVRNSELILFNRAEGIPDLATYKRNIKMVNQQAEIVFEGTDAEISLVLDEELPYDLNEDVIKITEENYGIWFMDTLDNTQRYIGKTVSFIGEVLKREGFANDYLVVVRSIMTCCEDDIARLGFACKFQNASAYKEGDWVEIEAVVHQEFWDGYNDEGPVLYVNTMTEASVPVNKVIDFK